MQKYLYEKVADSVKLSIEINNSDIETSLNFINTIGENNLEIFFEEALTNDEKLILDGLVENFTMSSIGDKKYLVQEYSNRGGGNLLKETWYHTDNEDGTYSGPVEETEYNYTNNRLINRIEREYYLDGTIRNEKIFNYYEQVLNNKKRIVLKIQ